MNNFVQLSQEELAHILAALPTWRAEDGKLKASFTFKDFKTAFAFITAVADKAEEMNHHPTWTNTYNKVSFAFSTHDADNKITNLDTDMAQFISDAAKKFQ